MNKDVSVETYITHNPRLDERKGRKIKRKRERLTQKEERKSNKDNKIVKIKERND